MNKNFLIFGFVFLLFVTSVVGLPDRFCFPTTSGTPCINGTAISGFTNYVSSISAGTGLLGGVITSSGTLSVNFTLLSSLYSSVSNFNSLSTNISNVNSSLVNMFGNLVNNDTLLHSNVASVNSSMISNDSVLNSKIDNLNSSLTTKDAAINGALVITNSTVNALVSSNSTIFTALNQNSSLFNKNIAAVNSTAVASITNDSTLNTKINDLNSSTVKVNSDANISLNWTYLQNYPSACPTGYYLTQLNDSVTCTAAVRITGDNITGRLTVSGNVGIGTNNPTSSLQIGTGDYSAYGSSVAVTTPASTSNGKYAFRGGIYQVAANNSNNLNQRFWGLQGYITTASSTGNYTGGDIYGPTMMGLEGGVSHSGKGNVPSATGGYFYVSNGLNGNISTAIGGQGRILIDTTSTGNITNAKALSVSVEDLNGSGHISNAYGLYIGTLQGNLSNYAIYSDNTAPTYLGGNIGIGTTTPVEKLHVVGSILVNVTGTTDAGLAIAAAPSGRAQLIFGNSTLNDATQSTTGEIWRIGMTGAGGTSFSFFDGTQNALSMDRAGNITMVPTIGKVGIGTTSPSYKLDVVDTSFTQIHLNRSGNEGFIAVGSASGGLYLGSNGTSTAMLNIQPNGNVGIGTTSPQQKLTVVGTANITSSIYASGITQSSGSACTNGMTIKINVTAGGKLYCE